MLSTRSALSAASLAALAIGSGAAVSGAATTAPRGDRTIRLVERGGGVRVIDNAPKARHPFDFSPGDIVVVTRLLDRPAGGRAGSLQIVCVATTASVQQCTGTATLAGGTLEFAGLSRPSPATVIAVVGGTGAYAGARGTSSARDRRGHDDVADETITLVA